MSAHLLRLLANVIGLCRRLTLEAREFGSRSSAVSFYRLQCRGFRSAPRQLRRSSGCWHSTRTIWANFVPRCVYILFRPSSFARLSHSLIYIRILDIEANLEEMRKTGSKLTGYWVGYTLTPPAAALPSLPVLDYLLCSL